MAGHLPIAFKWRGEFGEIMRGEITRLYCKHNKQRKPEKSKMTESSLMATGS